MRSIYLTLIALPILFCTCGPAQLEPVERGFYTSVSQPDTTVIGHPEIASNRILIEGGSLTFLTDYLAAHNRIPAYAADSTLRFEDTLYAVYQPHREAEEIDLVIHSKGGSSRNMRYRSVKTTEYAVPGDDIVGKTYLFNVDGDELLLHFETREKPLGLFRTRDSENTGRLDFRKLTPITLIDGKTTFKYSYGEKIGNSQVRIHELLLAATEGGTPQLYLRKGFIYEPDVMMGPYVGELYPSLAPENEADQNLFQQLSRGRLEVQPLPPEPDSLGSAWQLAYFLEHGGLRKSDIPKLDFVFRDDGSYTLFVGDRQLREGSWKISADRNFITFDPQYHYPDQTRFFTEYTNEYFEFPVPVDVVADRQVASGDRVSVYKAEVGVRFYR